MPGSRPPIVIPPPVEDVRASPPSPSAPGTIHKDLQKPHQSPTSVNAALMRRNAFYQPPAATTFFAGAMGAADNSVSAQVRSMREKSIVSGPAFGALRRGQPAITTPGGVPVVGDYGDAIRDAVGWAVIRERPESTAGSNAASGTYRYPSSNMVVGAALAGQYGRRGLGDLRSRGLGAAIVTPAGYPLVGDYGNVIGRDVGQIRERLESNAGSNAASGTYKYPSRQMVTGAALNGFDEAIDAVAAQMRARAVQRQLSGFGAQPLVNNPPRLRPERLSYRQNMPVISSSPSDDRKRILSTLMGLGGAYTSVRNPLVQMGPIDGAVYVINNMVKPAIATKLPDVKAAIDSAAKSVAASPLNIVNIDEASIKDFIYFAISKVIIQKRLSLTSAFKTVSGLDLDIDTFLNNVLPEKFKLPWDFAGKELLLSWRSDFLQRLYKYMWGTDLSALRLQLAEEQLKNLSSAGDAINLFAKAEWRPPTPPTVASYSPQVVNVGDTVTIIGSALLNKGASLNDRLLDLIINTDSKLTFKVPDDVYTGPLMVGEKNVGTLTIKDKPAPGGGGGGGGAVNPGGGAKTATSGDGASTGLLIAGVAGVVVLAALAMRK